MSKRSSRKSFDSSKPARIGCSRIAFGPINPVSSSGRFVERLSGKEIALENNAATLTVGPEDVLVLVAKYTPQRHKMVFAHLTGTPVSLRVNKV